MPIVSRFYGIVIALYWEDHQPPHFHAKYAGQEALVEIRTGVIIEGALSRRPASLVEEWRTLHSAQLMENWDRARRREPLQYIAPLE